METSCSKIAAKRLLKCFCGGSDLSKDEVKRIYRLSAQETLINKQACKLLRKYLETQRMGDKSETEQMLDVYYKFEEYLRDFRLRTEDEIKKLSDLDLICDMEKEQLTNWRTGEKLNIKLCLSRIQVECRNKIETSKEYSQFKEAILNKLKQVKSR